MGAVLAAPVAYEKEIIIVDDASFDGTREILGALEAEFAANSGVGGDFVGFAALGGATLCGAMDVASFEAAGSDADGGDGFVVAGLGEDSVRGAAIFDAAWKGGGARANFDAKEPSGGAVEGSGAAAGAAIFEVAGLGGANLCAADGAIFDAAGRGAAEFSKGGGFGAANLGEAKNVAFTAQNRTPNCEASRVAGENVAVVRNCRVNLATTRAAAKTTPDSPLVSPPDSPKDSLESSPQLDFSPDSPPNPPAFTLKIIYHEKNQGKGAALRSGIAAASGGIVLIQDADLEYDPAEYPRLLAPFERGVADVVFGSRFISAQSHRVLYFWHRVANGVLTLLSNMATNLNLTDMETCYKVFRAEIIHSIRIRENRFGFEPEITAKIAKIKGVRVYEVGISYYGRTYEEGKKIGLKDAFRAIFAIVKYRFFD